MRANNEAGGDMTEGLKALSNAVVSRFPDRAFSPVVFSFNDNPETTFEDVVSVINESGL